MKSPCNTMVKKTTARHVSRRGMGVIMVMLLLSLTLGLCYVAMRGQYANSMIRRNFDRRTTARQAAMTGMSMAIKQMHRSDWAGVGGSISGAISTYETYTATFTAGDSSISSSNSDQPYRVTIVAKGYAADSINAQSIATYQITAVVRFIPRQFASEPSDWTAMSGYTFYQTAQYNTLIDIPCRFTGPVRLQKKLLLAPNYPDSSDARTRYLSDLNTMRQNGYSDYRPFNGPVYLPVSSQISTYYSLLTSSLGVTTNDVTATTVNTNWSQPSSLTTYRIYPGGPSYTIQSVSSSLASTTLQPDVATNPLGLFYYNGSVTLGGSVTVQGSLFCTGTLKFSGKKNSIQPVALEPLAGSSSTTYQLAAASCGSATISSGGSTTVNGLMAVFGSFNAAEDTSSTTFALTGQLVAEKLAIEPRTAWYYLSWSWYYYWFTAQLSSSSAYKYFPTYMTAWGYDWTPTLTFAQGTSTVTHWATSYDPIFVAHSNDGGLRWNLISWSESQ